MRIQTDQKIVGHPALRIRQLMRETVGRPITLRYVQEILQCSDSSARRVMRKLEAEGFAQSVQGHLEPSIKGSALAMAKAAPALRRETAERLISDVISRARALNRYGKWAYRIGTLIIFGSCVRGADRPNDVDIACELVPRCGFRCKWSTDSGVKWSVVPVEVVQSSGGKWSSFSDRARTVDHIPESWTAWNGTADRITGMGQ